MRGIGKSCSPQTPPIFVRAIFRPRSSIWITNFSKKNKSINEYSENWQKLSDAYQVMSYETLIFVCRPRVLPV